MNTSRRGLAAAALALAVSGCAASPESIKPANINMAQYAYMNCAQLADFKVTLTNVYNNVADSENNARRLDAAGSVLLGFPLGTMTHQSVPYQIADLKGRIAAVDKLQIQANCGAPRQTASAS